MKQLHYWKFTYRHYEKNRLRVFLSAYKLHALKNHQIKMQGQDGSFWTIMSEDLQVAELCIYSAERLILVLLFNNKGNMKVL